MNKAAAPDELNPQRAVKTPRIVLDDVSLTFARRGTPVPVLNRVSLSVEDGTFVSILGPSGCGKTTLLRVIDGLVKPDTGTVRVSGSAPVPGPDMAFVFQTFRLIPWATVRQNIEFALKPANISAEEKRERIERYISLVGLTRFIDAYPGELSGGMSQRVALARALACEPKILLMDEPFASIDAQTRELMQAELMRLWNLSRSIVMFVTHSVDEAVLLSDKIVLMSPRPGTILEVIDVGLGRPRHVDAVRQEPRFIELRTYLWDRIRTLVLSDPSSDFYGRDLGPEMAPAASSPSRREL